MYPLCAYVSVVFSVFSLRITARLVTLYTQEFLLETGSRRQNILANATITYDNYSAKYCELGNRGR